MSYNLFTYGLLLTINKLFDDEVDFDNKFF